MKVAKRNGTFESVSFDKITKRLTYLCSMKPELVEIDPVAITQKVCSQIYDGVSTSTLDELAAQLCISMVTENSEYGVLASRIIISNNQKNTSPSFSETVSILYNATDEYGKSIHLISEEVYDIVMKNKKKLNDVIKYERDFNFDYFGFKTLEKAYLLRINKVIIERIQHLLMRVAIGLHKSNIARAIETYDYMSQKYFIHATPTLFHAGTAHPAMLSCFLLGIEDSVVGIYKCLSDCAQISKFAGGIGIHISNIRSKGSVIHSTNGRTDGIVPMLRVFNETARYINQSGKRLGSFAIYLEPWHADIEGFLDLKKNHGDENARARDLFYSMYIPDLFMKRIAADADWHLFCPSDTPKLTTTFGAEWEKWYDIYAKEGKARHVLPARKLWVKIINSQIETGTPYLVYKDAVNYKSNQQNLGIIKSSNLCVAPDTMILTDKGYYEIQELANQQINVWNGIEFSKTEVLKTGEDSDLIEISFNDGSVLKCTPYHKFYIQKGYINRKTYTGDILNHKNVHMVEADELRSGMRIIKCDYPVIDNERVLDHAYTNGLFSADGTYSNVGGTETPCKFKSLSGKAYCKRHIQYQKGDIETDKCCGISYSKKPYITLYKEKIALLEYLDYHSHGEIKDNKLNVKLNVNIEDKFFVPINYSLSSKMEWFSGYADGDGCITRNGKSQSLQIGCIHKEFLTNVKFMLQTCGINPKVTKMRNRGKTILPDGKGGNAEYATKPLWRLLINGTDLNKLVELGFKPNRLVVKEHTPNRDARKFVEVSEVNYDVNKSDTYCFNEPKRHTGIFNGVIAGNCTEILEYSDSKEYACCTLGSIGLPRFVEPKPREDLSKEDIVVYSLTDCKFCDKVKTLLGIHGYEYTEHLTDRKAREVKCDGDDGCEAVYEKRVVLDKLAEKYGLPRMTKFPQVFIRDRHIGGFREVRDYFNPTVNFKKLADVTAVMTRNLNNVIDLNFYPVPETELSNKRHRPLGIGVQGLADLYMLMRYPFDSEEAAELNKKVFATIYYAAMRESVELAKREGAYSTFKGSPLSEGKFQFDLWEAEPERVAGDLELDWEGLRAEVMEHGVRNSLLLAPMPTASTSQILGNNECIEPYTSNIYARRTLSGDFVVVNKHMLNDLKALGLWSSELKDFIILNKGSIQNIKTIPDFVKELYKTSWDLSQKSLIDQAADRGIYVCQSQSLNLFQEDTNVGKLSSMHFYAWKKGLKTGLYYLRSRPATSAQQFTIDPKLTEKFLAEKRAEAEASKECESCSA